MAYFGLRKNYPGLHWNYVHLGNELVGGTITALETMNHAPVISAKSFDLNWQPFEHTSKFPSLMLSQYHIKLSNRRDMNISVLSGESAQAVDAFHRRKMSLTVRAAANVNV